MSRRESHSAPTSSAGRGRRRVRSCSPCSVAIRAFFKKAPTTAAEDPTGAPPVPDGDDKAKELPDYQKADTGDQNMIDGMKEGAKGELSITEPARRTSISATEEHSDHRGRRKSSTTHSSRTSIDKGTSSKPVEKKQKAGEKSKHHGHHKKRHSLREDQAISLALPRPESPPMPIRIYVSPACGIGGQGTGTATAMHGDYGMPASAPLQTNRTVTRSYRKKLGKLGDQRRSSIRVEEQVTTEYVEQLGGNPPPSTPGTVALTVPPQTSVRQYRYRETRRPASPFSVQWPWAPYWSPNPLCPLHSPPGGEVLPAVTDTAVGDVGPDTQNRSAAPQSGEPQQPAESTDVLRTGARATAWGTLGAVQTTDQKNTSTTGMQSPQSFTASKSPECSPFLSMCPWFLSPSIPQYPGTSTKGPMTSGVASPPATHSVAWSTTLKSEGFVWSSKKTAPLGMRRSTSYEQGRRASRAFNQIAPAERRLSDVSNEVVHSGRRASMFPHETTVPTRRESCVSTENEPLKEFINLEARLSSEVIPLTRRASTKRESCASNAERPLRRRLSAEPLEALMNFEACLSNEVVPLTRRASIRRESHVPNEEKPLGRRLSVRRESLKSNKDKPLKRRASSRRESRVSNEAEPLEALMNFETCFSNEVIPLARRASIRRKSHMPNEEKPLGRRFSVRRESLKSNKDKPLKRRASSRRDESRVSNEAEPLEAFKNLHACLSDEVVPLTRRASIRRESHVPDEENTLGRRLSVRRQSLKSNKDKPLKRRESRRESTVSSKAEPLESIMNLEACLSNEVVPLTRRASIRRESYVANKETPMSRRFSIRRDSCVSNNAEPLEAFINLEACLSNEVIPLTERASIRRESYVDNEGKPLSRGSSITRQSRDSSEGKLFTRRPSTKRDSRVPNEGERLGRRASATSRDIKPEHAWGSATSDDGRPPSNQGSIVPSECVSRHPSRRLSANSHKMPHPTRRESIPKVCACCSCQIEPCVHCVQPECPCARAIRPCTAYFGACAKDYRPRCPVHGILLPTTTQHGVSVSCGAAPCTARTLKVIGPRSVKVRIKRGCSVVPQLQPATALDRKATRSLTSFPHKKRKQELAGDSVYILVQNEGGQEKLYKAKPLSPVIKSPSREVGLGTRTGPSHILASRVPEKRKLARMTSKRGMALKPAHRCSHAESFNTLGPALTGHVNQHTKFKQDNVFNFGTSDSKWVSTSTKLAIKNANVEHLAVSSTKLRRPSSNFTVATESGIRKNYLPQNGDLKKAGIGMVPAEVYHHKNPMKASKTPRQRGSYGSPLMLFKPDGTSKFAITPQMFSVSNKAYQASSKYRNGGDRETGDEKRSHGRGLLPPTVVTKEVPASWYTRLYRETIFTILVGIGSVLYIITAYLLYQSVFAQESFADVIQRSTFPDVDHTSFAVYNFRSPVTATTQPLRDVYLCPTKLCVQEGRRIRRYVTGDSSPCENFYSYACDAWETALANFSGSGVAISVDTLMEESLAASLRDYILDEHQRDVSLVRTLFKACVRPIGNASAYLSNEVFAKLPIRTWPYAGRRLRFVEMWRMAGTLIRKYGVSSILDVTLGVHRGSMKTTIEISYPRYLYLWGNHVGSDVSDTLRAAVQEAARGVGKADLTERLLSEISSLSMSLANLAEDTNGQQMLVTILEDLNNNIRVFLRSVFGDNVSANTTVVLRNPRVLIDGLQALTKKTSVAAFVNYIGFRVVVHFAPLFARNRAKNLWRVISIELAGRSLAPEMDWLLCLRLVENVHPGCLIKAQVAQQTSADIDATSRTWLTQLEGEFLHSLRSLTWMTDKSAQMISDLAKTLRVARFFSDSSSSEHFCDVELLTVLDKGSSIRMFVRVAGSYQQKRLHKIRERTRPEEPVSAFGTNSRYSAAQHTVHVPVGLVNISLVAAADSALLAFHASRTAVRLYKGLLPLVYEHWDSNEEDEQRWALSEVSRSRLAQLLHCLASDFGKIQRTSRPTLRAVVADSREASYPLLEQTTALALAYAAFQALLNKDRTRPIDFRLHSLGDVSSDQLFFLYYALDNCERSDYVYQARQFRAHGHLPPEYRVNLPLRHLAEFGSAFGCSATSGLLREQQFMAATEGSRCDVLRSPGNSSSGRRFSWGDLGVDSFPARSKARLRRLGTW